MLVKSWIMLHKVFQRKLEDVFVEYVLYIPIRGAGYKLQVIFISVFRSTTLLVTLKITVIIITGEEDDERQKSHSDI